MTMLDASIDTSFWNVAAQIGVVPYLFAFFRIHYCQALERAIQAYMRREVDLRGGAALAGVSYNHFLREVQARHIVILEDSAFLDRLYELAETFENLELQEAIQKVEAVSSG